MRRMPVNESARGLPRNRVVIVPYKSNVPKQDLLLLRSLNDQNRRKALDEIGGIVEYEIALLHPAVGVKRIRFHAKDPRRKDAIAPQEVHQGQRIEQTSFARGIEKGAQVHEGGNQSPDRGDLEAGDAL